jgi:3-oxoacyl-(acyl-carrier-protein) synthase
MSEQKPVYVVGLGIITSMGFSVADTIDAFIQHRSGIAPLRYLKTRHSNDFPCGEVKATNQDLALKLGLKQELSRTILLSYHAVREALSGFDHEEFNRHRFGFISASTVGGMDRTEDFFNEYMQDSTKGHLRDVMHHDCGKPTDYVAQLLGFKGFVTTISTACSSSANTIMLGSRMIASGKWDVALVGGVDALTRFTLNGFNTLMIVDRNQCRPLDQSRVGLNLGEGAGYLLLMSATPICKISGYGNANDSFHQTALSETGDGPYLAMTKALNHAKLKPGDIQYINMHGTGTQNNDQSEGKAIKRVFGTSIPMLSSTKSFTGHTLGASGSVEAVLSSLAIKHGYVFPNYSFETPMEGAELRPEIRFSTGHKLVNVLSNSFGFGGNCSSLILSK